MRAVTARLLSAAMERALFVVSGVYGFLAVALGAFGLLVVVPAALLWAWRMMLGRGV